MCFCGTQSVACEPRCKVCQYQPLRRSKCARYCEMLITFKGLRVYGYGLWRTDSFYRLKLPPLPYINKTEYMGDRKTVRESPRLEEFPTPSQVFCPCSGETQSTRYLASMEPRNSKPRVCGVIPPPAGQNRHCRLCLVFFFAGNWMEDGAQGAPQLLHTLRVSYLIVSPVKTWKDVKLSSLL